MFKKSKTKKPAAKVTKNVSRFVTAKITKTLSQNTEFKHWFAGLPITAFEAGPSNISIDCMTPITVGTGRVQRVGNEITLKHMQVRYTLRQVSGINAYSIARVMVVQIKELPATIAISKLLELDVLGVQSVYSVRNIDFMHLYNVLYDKTHKLMGATPVNNSLNDSSVIYHTANIPLRKCKKKIQYSGLNATDGIYIFVMSDVPGPIGPGSPTATLEYEISYTDS